MTLLACRNVCLRAGARRLIDGLDLVVGAGQRWAVLGPNGAGKSTLLSALAGVRRVDEGCIEIDGRPIDAWSIADLAERRALVTDRWRDPFSATVLDVVQTARYRLGPGDRDGARVALAALTEMDCAALAQRDVRWLSRGERQRVAVATALAQQVPLMLLDEPVAHQDPRHQHMVLRRLGSHRERTFVASLHDVNAAAGFASHVLLLYGDGRWRAGAASDLLLPPLLGELYGSDIRQCLVDGRARYFSAD
jgi:iron complex transport system ATP-binding protein